MRTSIRVSAALLGLLAAGPAFAQTQTAPTTVPSEVVDPGNPGNLVRVSIGDWSVKTGLASELGVKTSALPMTVSVSPEIAARVCPLGRDDLEQQKVVSATRTCAAKSATPELREAVGRNLRAPE
ncbi:hypothetical protein [Aurantimonas sp. Leaf443]|uniref:hypothetical protein n=1 Tax=Aurantimonas sp. Leaf443 TaxID=1736378 RepID=UPI00070065F7|nr:hypothetical protein [Aurantimonas sp. Leaf443]KQT83399.1 hypothetical protein ASG48_12610 [Aurantimonas sp. Leaf443]